MPWMVMQTFYPILPRVWVCAEIEILWSSTSPPMTIADLKYSGSKSVTRTYQFWALSLLSPTSDSSVSDPPELDVVTAPFVPSGGVRIGVLG